MSVLHQTMSGLAHLHSLSIGEGQQPLCSLSLAHAAAFGLWGSAARGAVAEPCVLQPRQVTPLTLTSSPP